jgi:hypothetical protein
MFDSSSRYYNIETAELTVADPDGTQRIVKYKRRRFLPSAAGMTVVAEHQVAQGERLDNITAGYIDDPLKFWVLCDANEVMSPDELEEPGRTMNISTPGLGI